MELFIYIVLIIIGVVVNDWTRKRPKWKKNRSRGAAFICGRRPRKDYVRGLSRVIL